MRVQWMKDGDSTVSAVNEKVELNSQSGKQVTQKVGPNRVKVRLMARSVEMK